MTQGANITRSKLKNSQPIVIDGGNNRILNDLMFTGKKTNAISIKNVNGITIDSCYFENIDQPSIRLENCRNIKIKNVAFDNVNSGIYMLNCSGFQIEDFSAKNIYRKFDGNGERINQFGQVVQGDKCYQDINDIYSYVKNGAFLHERGSNNVEDQINFYKYNGIKEMPLIIEGNWARGGGDSPTGTFILVGDFGSSWIVVRDNKGVNTGQVGIGVAGGNNITVEGNEIWGEQFHNSNIALYAWAQHLEPEINHSNKFVNNKCNWKKYSDPNNPWDDYWFSPNAGVEVNEGNTTNDQSISPEIVPMDIYNPFIEEDSSVPTGGDVIEPENPETMEKIIIDCSKQEALQYFEGNPNQTENYVYSAADNKPLYFEKPIPNGDYKVTVECIEDYWSQIGQRVFDIYSNGGFAIKGIDLIEKVGKNNVWVKTFNINVSHASLGINFNPTVNRALVSKITIEPIEVVEPETPIEEPVQDEVFILKFVETGETHRVTLTKE